MGMIVPLPSQPCYQLMSYQASHSDDRQPAMQAMNPWSLDPIRYDDVNKEYQKELAGLQAKFQSQYGK